MSKTAASASVVEHTVGSYEATDNPETHMPSANVPKFCLKPKHEQRNKFYYGVRIVTGSQNACSATARDVFFAFTGTKSHSDRVSLGLLQRLCALDSFHKEKHDDMIIETDQQLGNIQMVGVGLRYDLLTKVVDGILDCHWYVDYISVIDFQENEKEIQFPCYHWLGYNNTEVTAVSEVAIPQRISNDQILKQQRKRQIQERQEQYKWQKYNLGDNGNDGNIMPLHFYEAIPVISLPVDEEFHRAKLINFLANSFKGVVLNGDVVTTALGVIDDTVRELLGISTDTAFQQAHNLYVFEQMSLQLMKYEMQNRGKQLEITRGFAMKICQASRWITDEEFGRQILNGVNPVVIRRCSKLPDHFHVNHDMLKHLLVRNMTLEDEMEKGHMYICDLSEIMDGLPCRKGCYCAAPICLLYVNGANKLVPIAIQLKRDSGPVFLPSDDWFDWVLAKIYYRSADAQFHELSSHFLACHAAMESYAVATMRTLPDAHPVCKLLLPHYRYTIGINTAARLKLINNGGIIDQAFSIGGKGKVELLRRAYNVYDVRGADIKYSVKNRQVDDDKLLPNYYYRDDGIKIWDAIESYVRKIIHHFYKDDKDVKGDEELQSWANEVCIAFPKSDHAPEGHGFSNKIESREKLIHHCTLIIFNGSAQHAAVNFGQYDIYGFAPNAPFTLQKPPPDEKGNTSFADILESLPNLLTAGLSAGLVFSLSQFSPDEIFLGGYPNYWCSREALQATTEFVNEMQELDKHLRKRNEKLKMPYPYLLPSMVPNSITI